jgi:hypothetical protein
MSRVRHHVIFFLCFIGVSLLLSYLATLPASGWMRTASAYLVPVGASMLGLLVAQRGSHLSFIGLLASGALISALLYAATWAFYNWLALPAGGSVPFWRLAQVAGWPYLLAALAVNALAPARCWLLSPRPNNPFKATPLRGAA